MIELPTTRRSFFPALALLAALVAPGLACAQSGDGDSLKSAGDEAKFRVIERFPDDGGPSDGEGDSEAIADALRDALHGEDWGAARRWLDKHGADTPTLTFIDGYVALKRDNPGRAVERFEKAADEYPRLHDYASYLGARAAVQADNAHRAVLLAAQIPASSLKYGDGLAVLARALLETGTKSDIERAIRVMRTYLDDIGGDATRELTYALGETLGRRGDWEAAAGHLVDVWRSYPLSEAADKSRRLLEANVEKLPDSYRKIVEDPPRELRLAYFEALFEAHNNSQLVEELGDAIDAWTPGTPARCRALYWMAKTYTKKREHGTASKWYDKILEECEGISPWERNALYLSGKGHWNIGEREAALETFERLWTEFDHHSFADDAMYFAARIHRERDDGAAARSVLKKQVEAHPTGDMAENAHWLLVRQMIDEGKWKKVIDYVDGLETTGEDDRYTRGRLHYFRARAHERLGHSGAARKAYRAVADAHPMNYYGLLAANRLVDLAGSIAAACAGVDGKGAGKNAKAKDAKRRGFCARATDEADAPDVPSAVRKSPRFRKGMLLLDLGLTDLARGEFRALFDAFSGRDDALVALADLLDRAGAHTLAHRLPGRVDGWRDSYPDEQTRRLWTIAYPRAFAPVVRKWADERGLPEGLVWAIMRKESAFTARIKSWAGARGLMQLMPGTADMVARRLGMGRVGNYALLEPETNVRLGTAYMEGLGEKGGGHPALIAAGYNGGWGNISRWLEARDGESLDLWVEDIPYGQTRRYAKLVLANWWVYERLYDGVRVPELSFELP